MKCYLLRRNIVTMLIVSIFISPCCLYADGKPVVSDEGAVDNDSSPTGNTHTLESTRSRVEAQESVNALSEDIQNLKLSVIALNKDLRVLEEDLLFPANTQVNVFLSLDVGKFFTLESVKLNLDGDFVASHIYSDKELAALSRGGIHKLHMANLSVGEHTLSAFFTGIGPSGREYKRGTSLKIKKESGAKHVELRISDSSMKLQPEFSVEQW